MADDNRRNGGKPLEGRVCAITGGSKGMGRAFCELLVANGARVAILARPSPEMDSLVQSLGAAALAAPCDMGDPETVHSAIDRTATHFGRLDTVISNAAIVSLLKIETASAAAIQREMAVNLIGPIHLTQAAIPYLRAAGGGDLVFMSSESVRMPYPYLTLYGAGKGAIEVFAAGMRNELRDQGTRVTIVRSGSVEGSNLEKDWDPDTREAFFQACAVTGNSAFSGEPATRTTMAQAMLSLLCLPRDANTDLLEIRGR